MVRENDKIYKWREIVAELFEPATRKFEKCPECKGIGWIDDDRCINCEGEGEVRLLSDDAKPYATMKDGPDKYLFRKDGKQKLVGSVDNELEEDDTTGYQYRDEVDYEEDNRKIWHYGKAPGEDWTIIDRSPYAPIDDIAWPLYVDFHKKNGRWPTQKESRRIEDLEHKLWDKKQ